jgi:uncharacterized protein RhaS with RHS repeats
VSGDTNLYVYALNDPVNFIDSTGLQSILDASSGAIKNSNAKEQQLQRQREQEAALNAAINALKNLLKGLDPSQCRKIIDMLDSAIRALEQQLRNLQRNMGGYSGPLVPQTQQKGAGDVANAMQEQIKRMSNNPNAGQPQRGDQWTNWFHNLTGVDLSQYVK